MTKQTNYIKAHVKERKLLLLHQKQKKTVPKLV